MKNTLARKVKIPGFGHRVYRTEDPRATHLRVLSEELGKRTGQEKLYQLSKRMEETVKAVKGLNPNVDFYSASTYYSLGIPIDLYHADFRREPHVGLDGARAGAVPQQPADPPARRVQRQSRRPDLDSDRGALIAIRKVVRRTKQ